MFNLGFSEIIIIGVIALIFIGPKQLPEIARTLGRFINELKRSSDTLVTEFKNAQHENPSFTKEKAALKDSDSTSLHPSDTQTSPADSQNERKPT